MRVCITTTNREVGDYVFDLLTNPLSGHGCLCGSKFCIDDHIMVPDVMEFDLDEHEIEEVQKIEGVIRVSPSGIGQPVLANSRRTYKVRTPDVIYRHASYTYADNLSAITRPRQSPSQAGLNLGPSYQYYATTHQPSATHLVPITNNRMTSAFSLDCREVDIIIMDTGVDPSCEDLKTMYGENSVQIFDWTQVVDGFQPFLEYVNDLSRPDIITTVPNYVVFQNYNNDPNSNGVDNASATTYNSGFINGSNGGTGGFQPWVITTVNGSPNAFIGSCTVNGFGNIDAAGEGTTGTGESFGLFAPAASRITASRSLRQSLPVGYEFSTKLATNLRNGNKGINLYNSTGQLLINFSATNNTFRFNNQTLNAATGEIGQPSTTATWRVVAKQTTATNLEVTLDRPDLGTQLTPSPLTAVNVTGVLSRIEYYNENGGGTPQDNLYFNDIRLQNNFQPSVPSIANYYVDWIGHGTECASIAAGLKCGMAKNARIFALNVTDLGAPFGYPFITCLKLVAGFILGKKNGWYGLSPTTPTILSCSWTVEGPKIAGATFLNLQSPNIESRSVGPVGNPAGRNLPISALQHGLAAGSGNRDAHNNDGLLAASFGLGGVRLQNDYVTAFPCSSARNQPLSVFVNNLPASDDVVDAYMRVFTENGMHVVVCAGNNNIDLNQKTPDIIPILLFREKFIINGVPTLGQSWAVLRQMVLDSTTQKYVDNTTGLVPGQDYVLGTAPNTMTYTYMGTLTTFRNYISPDVGAEFLNATPANPASAWNRTNFPLIKVGCVSPLGQADNPISTYDSGGYSRSFYDLLIEPYTMKLSQLYRTPSSPAGVLDCQMALFRATGSGGTWTYCANPIHGFQTPIEIWSGYRFDTGLYQGGPSGGFTYPAVGILFNDGVNNKNLTYKFSYNAASTSTIQTGPTNFYVSSAYNLTDFPYVKSPYSNFGPAVDVYAVGSATWSGVSNQMLDSSATAVAGTPIYFSQTGRVSALSAAPFFREGLFRTSTSLNSNLGLHGGLYRGKYKFANGTSAACPAVAGMLATFLTQYPRATPLEAKRWLESSSIKGKILTTNRTPYVSSLSGFNNTAPNFPGAFGVTFGFGRVSAVNFGSMGHNHNLTVFSNISSPLVFNGWTQQWPPFPFVGNATLESGGSTHLIPTDYFRNTNNFWTSAFFDRYFSNNDWGRITDPPRIYSNQNPGIEFAFPFAHAYLQNFFFQCRFFSDSNNRIAQAHPLRSAVLSARGGTVDTGTAYASSIYFNQFGATTYSTRLQIVNPTVEFVSLSSSEYRIGNRFGSVTEPPK